MNNLTKDLYQVMKPEEYKGYLLKNILDRWVCNKYLKSFETKEELKKFIDTLK